MRARVLKFQPAQEEEGPESKPSLVVKWPRLISKAKARSLYQTATLRLYENRDWLLCLGIAIALLGLAVIFITDLPLPAVWSR